MKPAVLITRPRAEAEDFAGAVAALGYDPVLSPLMSVDLLPLQDCPEVQAVVATSPQVFKHEIKSEWAVLPLFVMGQTSADRAREAGFKNIKTSPGNFADLTRQISDTVPAGERILYLRGETIRHDLKAALPAHRIHEEIIYRTHSVQELEGAIADRIRDGHIQIVTLFSPRAASVFADLIDRAGLTSSVKDIKLLCLSAAVLESVQSLPWQDIEIAAQPDQTGMLTALQGWRT